MNTRLLVAGLFLLSWFLITGSSSLPNLAFGGLLAALSLVLVRDTRTASLGHVHPLKLLRLFGLFVVELVKSGIKVAALVLRRDMKLDPGLVVVPITLTRDFEIALLANLITLTPGTLSVDVTGDRRNILVHCLMVDDPAAVVADIQNGFERAIREAFR